MVTEYVAVETNIILMDVGKRS